MVCCIGGISLIKKAILKASVFAIILAFIVSGLNSVLMIKSSYHASYYQGLYANTGDKYDVVLLGSSHMHAAINPNRLWHDFGITSFNYSSAGQTIDVTYYLLKEILKKQENPIVVVDLYYLGFTKEFGNGPYISNVLDNMKLSPNKVEAILACTPKRESPNYLFPFVKYLNRWKELSEDDYKFDKLSTYYLKGLNVGNEVFGIDNKSDVFVEGVEDIPPRSLYYLNKMIELSKKEGFKLVFTNAPYDDTSLIGNVTWHTSPGKMFNKVEEISKANNLTFINFNKKYDEMNFDFKSDMFNIGHLNLSGSDKVTKYFGEFLKENNDLKDHRNDKNYDKWNKGYSVYLEKQPKMK